jgi:hypothetical protein
MCGRYDEDGAHLFFKCKHVRHVWADLQLEGERQRLSELLSERETIEVILKMKPEIQSRVITLLYLWWSERCGVREGEQQRSSCQMTKLIGSYAAEWSPFKKAREVERRLQTRKLWKPPPENFIKINCDGAFYTNTRSGGWGFAIREWDGGVISTGYGKLEHVSEAFHAEIIACLQTVNRAADLGVLNVIIETDAAMVVQAVESENFVRCSAGGLIWELKIPRFCNLVADSLAAFGACLSLGAAPIMDIVFCISACKV